MSEKVDINSAGMEEWTRLRGVGPARAMAILKLKKKLGGFKSVSDLLGVSRLGEGFIERHRHLLVCKASRRPPFTPHRELRSSSRQPLKRKLPVDEKQMTLKVTRQSSHLNNPHTTSRRPLFKPTTGQRKTPHDIKLDLLNVYNQPPSRTAAPPSSSAPPPSAAAAAAAMVVEEESVVVESVVSTSQEDFLVSSSSQDRRTRPHRGMSLRSKHSLNKQLKGGVKGERQTHSRTGSHNRNLQASVVSSQSDDMAADEEMCATEQPLAPHYHHHRCPPHKDLQVTQWLETFMSWPGGVKLQALDRLMEVCEAGEVRHVMKVIEPQFQRDFISLLPKELALYVLSFLEAKDLLSAAQTCSYWHTLAEDNLLWKEKCQEEDITESLVYPGNTGRGRKVQRNDHHHTAGVRGSTGSLYKCLYLRQKQVENNWKTAYRTPKVLKGHDDHVITCLEFSGSKIVSGSDDNTLKVWSATTGRCLRTLWGHTGGVWSSQMSGSLIISGSTDRTLRVWNAETGVCKHTLSGHTSTVRCMHLHNKRVVSGSRDATLRVWDVETGQCMHILIGHVAAVRCVQYDGVRVVSGGYDYMVKIWDPETETCLLNLSGHTNRVYSLQFDGTHIVSGSLDTSIRVWNVETGVCVQTLIGHQSLTSGMELKNNILVSGNADSTVKVWNISTGQCLQTLHGPNKHLSAVTCLQFNGNLIITSSDDGTVKLWDLRSGDFIRNLVALESGGSGGVVWRIRCSNTKLVCAVGSRNGTEDTKLLVIDFGIMEEEAIACPTTTSIPSILSLPPRYN